MTEANLSPRIVGRYRLLEPIGRGGMGSVWEAFDPKLRRRVALKILHDESPQNSEQLEREARIAGRLRHPGIATIYETGVAGSQAYIAMEFVEGTSVDRLSMDPRRAAAVVREAALAVHYAHTQGVIHRDIKPGNLIVDRDGRVLVLDFGLARETLSCSSLSISGLLMGTPQFMSPEQAQGRARHADARTDVWGLGATLYSLLTGSPPFHGDSLPQVARRIVETSAPRPRQLNSRIPPSLETVVLKTLEKEPGRRYGSALHLAQDLGRFLSGLPIHAKPPSLLDRIRTKLAGRKRQAILAALAAASVAVAVGAWGARVGEERKRGQVRDRALAEADAHFRGNRFSEARSKYEEARAWGASLPEDRYARCVEEERRIRSMARREAELSGHLRRAEALLREAERARRIPAYGHSEWNGYLEEAIRFLNEGLARDPTWAAGYLARGRAWMEANDPDRAGNDFTEAIRWAPNDSLARFERGRACLERAFRASAQTDDPRARGRADEWRRRAEEDFEAGGRSGWTLETRELELLEGYRLFAAGNVSGLFDWTEVMLPRRPSEGRVWRIRVAALFGLRRYAEVEEACREALRLLGADALLRLALARAKEKRGDPAGAHEEATRSIEIDPRFTMGWILRGWLRGRLNDPQGQRSDAERLIELDPSSAWGYVLRSAARGASRDWIGMRDDSARALERDPQSAVAYSQRGRARGELGDWRGEVEDCTRAVEIDPVLAEAWANRGLAWGRLGRREEAMKDCTRALELNPTLAEVWYNRSKLWSDLRNWPRCVEDSTRSLELAPTAAAYFQRGSARYLLGEFRESEADFTRGLDLEPSSSAALQSRALVRIRLRDWRGVLRDCDAALALDPTSAIAYGARASARRTLQDWVGALGDSDAALARSPDLRDARVIRAGLYQRLGAWEASLRDCDRVLLRNPECSPAWQLRGEVWIRLCRWPEAIESLSHLLRLDPRSAAARHLRGYARLRAGDAWGALEDLSLALALDPSRAAAWNHRGQARMDLQDSAGALRDFGEAIERDPRHAAAYCNRAKVRMDLAHSDESLRLALADLENCLRISRDPAVLREAVRLREECRRRMDLARGS